MRISKKVVTVVAISLAALFSMTASAEQTCNKRNAAKIWDQTVAKSKSSSTPAKSKQSNNLPTTRENTAK